MSFLREVCPIGVDGMANIVEPDQTEGAVWSWSALFAKACLSENLGRSQYFFTVAVVVTTRPLDQTVFPRADLSRTTTKR